MAKRFNAQVRDWANKTKRRQLYIFLSAAQETFSMAQTPQPSVKETGGSFEVGKIPVDDGDLRGSFVSGLNGNGFVEGEDSYVLTIARARAGDSIMGGWRAEHALPIEFGTSSIEPRAFMRTAANKWKDTVSRYVKLSEKMS